MRMNTNRWTPFLLLVAEIIVLTTFSSATTLAQSEEPAILTVGSKAPALDIEIWFSDREGEFQHTTEFEPGKIYLVDFWATWSTPSQRFMSTYSELQDRYYKDGVQIISISDEDEDSVADFLELDMNDNSGMIYAEQTLNYCLTSDPDRSVFDDYMDAAQQTTIPTVFIVGKTGLIEWFGNPAKLKRPLKKIIAGDWDRAGFKKEALALQQMKLLATEVRKLMEAGDTEGALELIENMIADTPDSETKFTMQRTRLALMMQNDSPKLAEAFEDVVQYEELDSYSLNELAWSIVTREQGGKKIESKLLDVAAETAEKAIKIARTEEDDEHLGAILDTHAHLIFLKGDLEEAIEIQTEAMQFSPRPDIKAYLDELQQIKNNQENDAEEGDAEETESDADDAAMEPAGIES